MSVDEFFDTVIMDVEGVQVNSDRITFYKRVDDKRGVWMADVDLIGERKMIWVNWQQFYMPLIDNFKMSEDQVADLIKSKMKVDAVGFMPSLERHFRQKPTH